MRVLNCYEAGYEGFWLARWLDGVMALETVVLDAASLLVNRKAKQRKTDRIDAKKMVRALLAHDRGDAAVLSRVRVPTVEQEDRKRLHRERQRLVKERTSLTNSIKGLLKLHGIFDLQPRSKDFEAKFADAKTAYGEPFPPRARQEILRIAKRLALVEEQIAQVEAARDAVVKSGETVSIVDAPEGILHGHTETIGERLKRDLAAMSPLPATPYEACAKATGRVSAQSLVRLKTNDYSVPSTYGFREVTRHRLRTG